MRSNLNSINGNFKETASTYELERLSLNHSTCLAYFFSFQIIHQRGKLEDIQLRYGTEKTPSQILLNNAEEVYMQASIFPSIKLTSIRAKE